MCEEILRACFEDEKTKSLLLDLYDHSELMMFAIFYDEGRIVPTKLLPQKENNFFGHIDHLYGTPVLAFANSHWGPYAHLPTSEEMEVLRDLTLEAEERGEIYKEESVSFPAPIFIKVNGSDLHLYQSLVDSDDLEEALEDDELESILYTATLFFGGKNYENLENVIPELAKTIAYSEAVEFSEDWLN